jgi:uncharacterized membrane protein YdcZ (DUF606 family)
MAADGSSRMLAYTLAGLLGASHITLKVFSAPILGLGLDYLFVILGQLSCSLLIDTFGLLGVPKSTVTPLRTMAIVLSLVGAIVMMAGGDGAWVGGAGGGAGDGANVSRVRVEGGGHGRFLTSGVDWTLMGGVENIVNGLERITGLDIDQDGDVGLNGHCGNGDPQPPCTALTSAASGGRRLLALTNDNTGAVDAALVPHPRERPRWLDTALAPFMFDALGDDDEDAIGTKQHSIHLLSAAATSLASSSSAPAPAVAPTAAPTGQTSATVPNATAATAAAAAAPSSSKTASDPIDSTHGASLAAAAAATPVASTDASHRALAAFLSWIAGACHPPQAAAMHSIGRRHPDPFIVALISLGSGWVWLTLASLVCIDAAGAGSGESLRQMLGLLSWFDVLGGAAGASFLTLTILLTSRVGLNPFYVGMIAGQVISAVVVDALPHGPAKHGLLQLGLTPLRLIGVLLALFAIVLLRICPLNVDLPPPKWLDPCLHYFLGGRERKAEGSGESRAESPFISRDGFLDGSTPSKPSREPLNADEAKGDPDTDRFPRPPGASKDIIF